MPDWILPLLALIVLLGFFYFAFLHRTPAEPSDHHHDRHDGPPSDHV